MKRNIALRWAKALESGEYKQCKGQLRDGDRFCCLGVLCNLHAQEHPEIAAKQKIKALYLDQSALLPDAVINWAGMTTPYGFIEGTSKRLWAMNDDEGFTFAEIAKVIHKEYKKL